MTSALNRSHGEHNAAGSMTMMELLPVDLLVKVLELAELSDRLHFARCNTTCLLLKLATKDCSVLVGRHH